MNELVQELSLSAFITIHNTFTWFFATPEMIKWKLTVSHCTFRDKTFEYEGNDLMALLQQAIVDIRELNNVR